MVSNGIRAAGPASYQFLESSVPRVVAAAPSTVTYGTELTLTVENVLGEDGVDLWCITQK